MSRYLARALSRASGPTTSRMVKRPVRWANARSSMRMSLLRCVVVASSLHSSTRVRPVQGMYVAGSRLSSITFRGSIVASIRPCHGRDPGSIPGSGASSLPFDRNRGEAHTQEDEVAAETARGLRRRQAHRAAEGSTNTGTRHKRHDARDAATCHATQRAETAAHCTCTAQRDVCTHVHVPRRTVTPRRC